MKLRHVSTALLTVLWLLFAGCGEGLVQAPTAPAAAGSGERPAAPELTSLTSADSAHEAPPGQGTFDRSRSAPSGDPPAMGARAPEPRLGAADVATVNGLQGEEDGVTLVATEGTVSGVFVDGSVDPAPWRDLIGSQWVVGDLHATDVTPQLWRSLELELDTVDGPTARIEMIRPLWWLVGTGADVGETIDLSVTEVGLEGSARVLDISDGVKVDSRRSGGPIVVGTINRDSAEVVSLALDGDADLIGVTPTHPLYSSDRRGWVPAGDLRVGEAVSTGGDGVAVLTSIQRHVSPTPVYNLEVHRARSYLVGSRRIVAHNTGIDCGIDIALSVGEELGTFADDLSARLGRHVHRWDFPGLDLGQPRSQWEGIESAIGQADRIHFNLTGFDASTFMDWVGHGGRAGQFGRWTNQEFLHITTNSQLMKKTTFYLDGVEMQAGEVMNFILQGLR